MFLSASFADKDFPILYSDLTVSQHSVSFLVFQKSLTYQSIKAPPSPVFYFLPCGLIPSVYVCSVPQSCLTVRPRTVAHQTSLSMGLSRQEYWNGLPLPTSGNLYHPRIKPTFLVPPALTGRFFTTKPPGKSISSLKGSYFNGLNIIIPFFY